MSETRNYYRILHVDPDAPVEVVRASYRTLMQRMKKHPDLGGDHQHAALINEAYAVLTDPVRRAEYDRTRKASCAGGRRRRSSEPDPCPFCHASPGTAAPPEPEDSCGHCSSPLFPAEHLRLDASDQRLMQRMPRELSVTCYTYWPQSPGHRATMRDLSLNGMQVTAAFRVDTGVLVKVDSALCQSIARVAWCTPDGRGWLIGLEFVTLRFHRSRGSFVSVEA